MVGCLVYGRSLMVSLSNHAPYSIRAARPSERRVTRGAPPVVPAEAGTSQPCFIPSPYKGRGLGRGYCGGGVEWCLVRVAYSIRAALPSERR